MHALHTPAQLKQLCIPAVIALCLLTTACSGSEPPPTRDTNRTPSQTNEALQAQLQELQAQTADAILSGSPDANATSTPAAPRSTPRRTAATTPQTETTQAPAALLPTTHSIRPGHMRQNPGSANHAIRQTENSLLPPDHRRRAISHQVIADHQTTRPAPGRFRRPSKPADPHHRNGPRRQASTPYNSLRHLRRLNYRQGANNQHNHRKRGLRQRPDQIPLDPTRRGRPLLRPKRQHHGPPHPRTTAQHTPTIADTSPRNRRPQAT